MALIKSNTAATLVKDAIVLDLGDLRRQAAAMKAAAEQEARSIIAAAKAEAATFGAAAKKKGYEEGHAEGHAKGHAAGLEAGRKAGHVEALAKTSAAVNQLQQAWIAAAQTWDAERRQMLLDARQTLLTLAVEMATKIVHRVPQVDPTIVADQVAAAIEHVARPYDVIITIHPADRPLLEEAMPKLVKQFAAVQHAKLAEDETIARGGCVVNYGKGRIDATLDTQLNRLVDAMLGGPSEMVANGGDNFDDHAPPPPAESSGGGEGA